MKVAEAEAGREAVDAVFPNAAARMDAQVQKVGALICMSKCDLPPATLSPPPDHDEAPRIGILEAGGVWGPRAVYCSRARHHGEIRIIGQEATTESKLSAAGSGPALFQAPPPAPCR